MRSADFWTSPAQPVRPSPIALVDELVAESALSEAVLDSIDVGIVACDEHGHLTIFNRVSREFHGQPADGTVEEAGLAAHFDLYHSDGTTALRADDIPLLRALREGQVHDVEIVIAPHGMARRLVSCTGRRILDSSRSVRGAVIAMRDITDQREAEQRLRERALHDPLTGLPNRSWLAQRLDALLPSLGPDGATTALLFIDLDGFKLVNDVHGHIGGDGLLAQAADRLREVLRGDERAVRLGGDEFVLLCPRLAAGNTQRGTELARAVLDLLSRPFVVDGQPVRLSASVGIAFADRADVTATQLVARADAAMYAAKRDGRSRWSTYSERTVIAAHEISRIERLIRQALDNGALEVHYQPLLTLGDRRIVGVEALARLPDGEGGLVSPVDFIPVAERAGLISRIGAEVMASAAHQVAAWKRDLGDRDFGLGVNLSVCELDDPGLLERIVSVLDDSGLEPAALVLELTESVFSDSDAHTQVLHTLQDKGIKLFIDDFGTGQSSLSYLRRFTVDGIKIDRSFVTDIARARDRRVTQAIVSLSLDLGVPVIAEGIECEAQRSAVLAMGCQLGQGFLFSRPLPAEQFTALLTANIAG